MATPYYQLKGYHSRRSVGYLLRRAAKLITGRVEGLFFREEDVTFVQWGILMHLRDGLSGTAAELSQNLCHDSGALTRILDQMEARGLLLRQRSTQDRRVVELEITDSGRRIIDTHLPRLLALYNHTLAGFTTEEIDTLIGLLTRLVGTLSEAPKAEER